MLMDKGLNKKKGLVISLAALGGLVLILAIVMIVINSLPRGGDCVGIEDIDMRNTCLADVFEEKNDEKTNETYDGVLNQFLRDKDYIAFADVLTDKLGKLAMNGHCEEAMAGIDDSRLNQLPDTELGYYYRLAMGVALECGDDSMYEELDRKYWEVEERGNIETPSYEEEDAIEYEVYGEEE